MALPFLRILNISTRKAIRKIWQLFNLNYLYSLLYAFLIRDFRHVGDCQVTVALIRRHRHIVRCRRCGVLTTTAPITPIHVNEAIATSLLGMDPVTTFPARNTVLPSVQPFDPTSGLGLLKTNIGVETDWLGDLEGLIDDVQQVQQVSKFFNIL